MRKVNVQKRGKVFQYKFEIAPVNGKRKFINRSGFKTQSEAEKEGVKALILFIIYSKSLMNFKTFQ